MSEKAPLVLGGTVPNEEAIFGFREERDACDDMSGAAEMSSLCMNCHEDGRTRMLLTKIPYFREVIIMAFECEECGYANSEVTFGGSICEKGCRITLHVTSINDCNRQIIKSDTATISIPSLSFEIPPATQRGCINTIEVRKFLEIHFRILSF